MNVWHLLNFSKRKKNEFDQNKIYTIEEVVKIMKEQGYSPEEIKKQLSTEIHSRLMDGIQVELKPRDISEYKKKTNFPKPKGIYTEQWSDFTGYDKKASEYAKRVYEKKFGEIINSPLSDIIKNLNEIYFTSFDYFYFPDGTPDTHDYCLTIENYLEIWVSNILQVMIFGKTGILIKANIYLQTLFL